MGCGSSNKTIEKYEKKFPPILTPELACVLARSLDKDPLFIRFHKNPQKRFNYVFNFANIIAKDSNVFSLVTNDNESNERIVSGSIWRFSKKKISVGTAIKLVKACSKSLNAPFYKKEFWDFIKENHRIEKLESDIMKDQLHCGYYFCELFGTDTTSQNKGYGSRNMKVMTDMMDEEKMCGCLVSTNEKNLKFYKRHGFEVKKKDMFMGVVGYYLRRDPVIMKEE